MPATPATLNFVEMAQIVGNLGGAVQALPHVDKAGGRERCFAATLVLAAQASGSIFGVARLPLPFVLTGITLITDTSLATATIKLGNAGNANSAIYLAAQTFTSTNTPTRVGLTSTHAAEITSGFDSVTGLATSAYASSGFGGNYEDIIMTTAVASLPASGNLAIIFEYTID